jgi:SAM-dependent methyltransferase
MNPRASAAADSALAPLHTAHDDPRWFQVHRPPPKRDVPYLPTDAPVVAAMLRFAGVGDRDVLYDLGCGDGRIVLAAARRGARAIGVDIDPLRIRECRESLRNSGLGERASFALKSFFEVDLGEATVVTLYLLPSINVKLRPKILWECKPGTRVICNYFDMGDWPPDQRTEAHHRVLYKYIVPAWVNGSWNCVIHDPRSPRQRTRMILHLQRQYQHVWGSARLNRESIPLRDCRLSGGHFSFTLAHPRLSRSAMRFTCRMDDHYLRGTCTSDAAGARPMIWGAVRRRTS